MPGMDGLQASRQIRRIEAAQSGNSRMTSKGSEDSLSSSYQEEQVVPDTTGVHSSKGSSSKPLVRRVPIVGVSACSLTEQLKSAALAGLPICEGKGGYLAMHICCWPAGMYCCSFSALRGHVCMLGLPLRVLCALHVHTIVVTRRMKSPDLVGGWNVESCML